MALGLTERLRIVFDVETQSFKQGVRTLKADMASADGFVGKAKVGFKGLSDQLATYGPQAAMAAGAALVAFGAKSVNAFNDAALAAGKMADATGLTSEEASRLAEVGSDVGVGMDTLTSAVRRVNAAAESGALKQFGIDAVRTADGQLNVNETFLATVDALSKITDAGAREAAARKLLGKGWSEVSELVAAGADDMREKLAAVSDAQVFDREEVNKAREFRKAMDDLSDAAEQVMMTVGEDLTPTITKLAEGVGSLTSMWDKIPKGFREAATASPLASFIDLADGADELTGIVGYAAEAMADQTETAEDLERQMITTAESTDIAATSADNLRTALEELIGGERDAIAARRESDESTRAYNEALATLGGTLLDTEATTGDVEQATRDASDAALKASEDFAIMEAGSLDSAEGVRSQIESLQGMRDELDPGSPLRRNIQGHIDALKAIERSITTTVSVTYLNNGNGPTVDENGNVRAGRGAGGAGTPNALGDSALWAQAMSADLAGNAAASAPEDKGPTNKELCAAELKKASRKYAVGDYTHDQYIAQLQFLRKRYKVTRLSDNWMTIWSEIKRARKAKKDDAAAAAAQDAENAPDPWQQAENQQAVAESSVNLSQAQSQAMADLSDDSTENDAGALDSWARAIWDNIRARCNAAHPYPSVKWARMARRLLEQAMKDNPYLASRLAIYLKGVPEFPKKDKGGDGEGKRGAAGRGSLTTKGGMSSGSGGGMGGGGGSVTLNFPHALFVDGKAVRQALDMAAPQIDQALRRYERGQG